MTESHSLSSSQFIDKVYEICKAYNPDIEESSSFKEVLEQLQVIKDKAMRWEIIISSFKPEPELFPVRQTLAEARARQAEQRQGEL
tara:strand:+ start:123 stop:380 length:258 start_codon:yes stop_codon:yes gene_type:complete